MNNKEKYFMTKVAYTFPENPRLQNALIGGLGGAALGGGLGYGFDKTLLGAGAGGLAGGLLGYLKGRAEEKELDEIEAEMEANPEKYEYDTGNWLTQLSPEELTKYDDQS